MKEKKTAKKRSTNVKKRTGVQNAKTNGHTP